MLGLSMLPAQSSAQNSRLCVAAVFGASAANTSAARRDLIARAVGLGPRHAAVGALIVMPPSMVAVDVANA